MRSSSLISLLLASCLCAAGQTAPTGTTPPDPPSVIAPGWAAIAVPAIPLARYASHIFPNRSTGDLYVANFTRTPCAAVSQILRYDAAAHTWTDISGSTAPHGCDRPMRFIMLPNNRVFVVCTTTDSGGKRVNQTLYGWNGSITSPAWKRIGGGPATAQNDVYTNAYVTRADGTTCFSISGIYCNSQPNSLSFSLQTGGVSAYNLTGRGVAAPGDSSTGFIYALDDFDAGDGRGEQMWACGEGDALEFGAHRLGNLQKDFVDFVPHAADRTQYKGNCTAIVHGPTSMLIVRQADDNNPATGAVLTHIALPSMAPAIIAPSSGYGAYPSNNVVGAITYVSGTGNATRWAWSAQYNNTATRAIYYSTSDGAAWTDLVPSLTALDPACSGFNIPSGVQSDGIFLYTLCKNTTTGEWDFWRYHT